VTAQDANGFDPSAMMETAERAAQCYQNLDPSVFQKVETKGREIEAELKALCQQGKRDQAMASAMKYMKAFHESPEMAELQRCAKIMEGMPSAFNIPSFEEDMDDLKNTHICDDLD
jgi:hypothetical protein